jgi:ribosomal-protein-alanine N-acetyltransferase
VKAELRTERLLLRPYEPEDIEALHRLWTEPLVRRYLWDDRMIARAEAADVVASSLADWSRAGLGQWILRLIGVDAVVGFCGFRFEAPAAAPELLVGLTAEQWGRGLATEAAKAVLRYAFEVWGATRIWAATDRPNAAAIRLLERLGMRPEREEEHEGRRLLIFGLIAEDFRRGSSGRLGA